MKKKLWMAGALALIAALLWWALRPSALEVESAQVTQGDFERSLLEDGKTRVRSRYTVSAPLAGQLARIRLQPGDAVRPGDVVAVLWPVASSLLDDRSRQEQLERVAAMNATLVKAQANVARASAALNQALKDLERSDDLAQKGFVSPNQKETTRLALELRQQEMAMAEQEATAARHDLERLQIGLAPPRTGPRGAGPWPVTAPAAGRVLKLHRDSEGVVTAGTPLMDIGDPRQMEVVVDLLTDEAAQLPAGAKAELTRWGGARPLQARLQRIEPGAFTKVSALGVEEQRVHAVLDLTSAPEEWRSLGDGFKVEVRIVAQQAAGVMQVPVSALFAAGTEHAVFVARDGRARRTLVEVLARNERTAWVKTDLPPGTLLVAYPPSALKDGDRIQILKRP